MKCPHCQVEVHPAFEHSIINKGEPVGNKSGPNTQVMKFGVLHMKCPACETAILRLMDSGSSGSRLIFPRFVVERSAQKEVPVRLAEDFNESSAVLAISPKASAALSRRCLQVLLSERGYTDKDLGKAITSLLNANILPASLAANVDAIRNIGNFAAHPTKDTNTQALVEVEPEEAEWNLEVLEGLFDQFYVQPAKDQAKRDGLNAKLVAAGKPPLRS